MTNSAPATTRGGMLRALRHRDYRLFWIGMGVSLAGFQVQRVGLSYLAYNLTGSKLFLTLVFAGDSLPMLVLAPIGGVVVDKVNRRQLLIISRVLLGILPAIITLLIVMDRIAAWHLLVFALLTGALYSFDIPTRQAAIRDLVPDEDFFNAVALSSSVMQSTRIVGPAIGGIALGTIGPAGAFAAMTVGNLALVGLLFAIHIPDIRRGQGVNAFTNLKEGFRFIAGHEQIWSLMVIAAVAAMFAMTYQSLTPVFAQDILGQGKGAIGTMLAAGGVGALAGSIVVAAFGERLGRSWTSGVMAILCSLLVIAFAGITYYPLALGVLVLIGATGALYSVVNSTVVQAATPRDMQGRVMGVYQMTWNAQLVGSLIIGALADHYGAPAALAVAGALSAALIAVLMLARARRPASVASTAT